MSSLEEKKAAMLKEGIPEHEADLCLQDDDLWMLPATLRHPLESEEAVRQWSAAVRVLDGLHAMALDGDLGPGRDATEQVLGDALVRAEEQLRRARERVSS